VRIPIAGRCVISAMNRVIVHLVAALWVAASVCADQTIQSVQEALKDQGFYYGDVTGDKSAETTAAIRRYQIRNGLQVTGEINSETLHSLNLGASSKSAAPSQPSSKPAVTQSNRVRPDESSRLDQNPSPRLPSEPNRRLETGQVFPGALYPSAPPRMSRRIVVAEVQRQLTSRGYYPGRIDGRYGRRTAFAVRAFQWRAGIPPTARLDTMTLDALGLPARTIAYLESTPWQDGNWVPMEKFKHGKWKHGKWKAKWKKHHGDKGDEYGEGHGHDDED
jgi:peptidoglycan hydrolase-like protein with peptidoglycan-binding domain